jgi:hypothetical protein
MNTFFRRVTVGAILFAWTGPVVPADNAPWWTGTAYTLPAGRWEKGLFQPLRYGQTERLEWATHPVLNLVVPNLRVKVAHREFKGWSLATRHGFHYPTPLLRLVRRPGIGGLISPERDIPDIPHILAARSELLATRVLSPALRLTGKGGVSIALKSGVLDKRTTIDIPIVYPRMAAYIHGYQLNLGLDILMDLPGRWSIRGDTELLLIPGAEESFAFELGSWLFWSRSERFRVVIGYLLTYGEYPYGRHWQLMPYPLAFGPGLRILPFPMIDLQWARQRKAR